MAILEMDDSQHYHEQQQAERRSVAKEQWKHFLEALEEAEAQGKEGGGGVHDDDFDNKTTVTTTSTVAGTVVELAHINQDLEDTAGNLADLEIEFEEDLQCLQMGLESAFNNSFNSLNSSFENFNTLLNDNNELIVEHTGHTGGGDHAGVGDDELGAYSIRSYQTTTTFTGDIGTSIRSIRHHARGLDDIKKDIENTFRQNLQQGQQRQGRRMSMASVAGSVAVEEVNFTTQLEPEMEAKFQNWFGKVWKHVEELLEKRRLERQEREQQLAQQQQLQQQKESEAKSLPDCTAISHQKAVEQRSDNNNSPTNNVPQPHQPQRKPAAGMGLFHVKAVPNNPDMIEVNGSLYTHQEFKRLLRDVHNQSRYH